jgi:hypothetical protein
VEFGHADLIITLTGCEFLHVRVKETKFTCTNIICISIYTAFSFLERERLREKYIAQAGLKLRILLLLPPKCWNYKCAPPCPARTCSLMGILVVDLKFFIV